MWIDDRYYSDEEFFLRILKGKAEDPEKVDTRPAPVRVLSSASRKKHDEIVKRCKAYIDSCVKAGAQRYV